MALVAMIVVSFGLASTHKFTAKADTSVSNFDKQKIHKAPKNRKRVQQESDQATLNNQFNDAR